MIKVIKVVKAKLIDNELVIERADIIILSAKEEVALGAILQAQGFERIEAV